MSNGHSLAKVYSLGRQVVQKVLQNVFFEFPLPAIPCLGSMAATVLAQQPAEHLWNIQPNLLNKHTPHTVLIKHHLTHPTFNSQSTRAPGCGCGSAGLGFPPHFRHIF